MPPELIKKYLWVQGGAFRRHWEYHDEGAKWRFFFLLNKAPADDDDLLIVTATTKTEKLLRRFGLAVVVVDPREYPALERQSAINCALPEKKSTAELRAAIENHQISVVSPLPRSVLDRVLQAVERATTIPPNDKALILGEPDS